MRVDALLGVLAGFAGDFSFGAIVVPNCLVQQNLTPLVETEYYMSLVVPNCACLQDRVVVDAV